MDQSEIQVHEELKNAVFKIIRNQPQMTAAATSVHKVLPMGYYQYFRSFVPFLGNAATQEQLPQKSKEKISKNEQIKQAISDDNIKKEWLNISYSYFQLKSWNMKEVTQMLKMVSKRYPKFKILEQRSILSGFSSCYHEFKILSFVIYAQDVKEKFKLYGSKISSSYRQQQEIIYIKTSLYQDYLKKYQDELEVDMLSLEDLDNYLNILRETISFDGLEFVKRSPEFMYEKNKLSIFKIFEPIIHQSQQELIDVLRNEHFFVWYRAMVGSGKSTMTVPLIHFVNSEPRHTILIYACALEQVRFHISRLAMNTMFRTSKEKTKFNQHARILKQKTVDVNGLAIASWDESKNSICLKRSENCPDDKWIRIIVCDFESAEFLLSKHHQQQIPSCFASLSSAPDYILFVDEPNVFMEKGPEFKQNKLWKSLITLSPVRTIMCSATLPPLEQHPCHKLIPSDRFVKEIVSLDVSIGVDLCQFQHLETKQIFPHDIDIRDTKLVYQMLHREPFIRRFYSADYLLKVTSILPENRVKDIKQKFSSGQNMIHSCYMQSILDNLDLLPSDLYHMNGEELIPISRIVQFIINEKQTTMKGEPILLVCEDPIPFAMEFATQLTGFDRVSLLDKCNRIISKFIKIKKTMGKQKRDTQHSLSMVNLKKVSRTNREQLLEQIEFSKYDDMEDSDRSLFFDFDPEWRLDPSSLLPIEHMILDEDDCSVNNIFRVLLLSGIGIFSPSNSVFNQPSSRGYTKHVMSWMRSNSLSLIICDPSIAYGTNIPVNHVFIDNHFTDHHSIETLYQLMGRVGRVGKSYKGSVIMCPYDVHQLQSAWSYICDPSSVSSVPPFVLTEKKTSHQLFG